MDLKAYAEASGKARTTLTDKVKAYRVMSVTDIRHDDAQAYWSCLAQAHAAPEWLWPALVSQMVGDRVMPSAKPEALRDAMANCDSRSPQHFRSAVESWGDSYYYASSSSREEDATEQRPEPEITAETAPEPVNSQPETEAESVIQEDDVKMPACTAL
jgi:hypothetical protein